MVNKYDDDDDVPSRRQVNSRHRNWSDQVQLRSGVTCVYVACHIFWFGSKMLRTKITEGIVSGRLRIRDRRKLFCVIRCVVIGKIDIAPGPVSHHLDHPPYVCTTRTHYCADETLDNGWHGRQLVARLLGGTAGAPRRYTAYFHALSVSLAWR